MGANHLNDVSHSGCVTEPGEHIAELPNSSSDIDWRKPIKNGNTYTWAEVFFALHLREFHKGTF